MTKEVRRRSGTGAQHTTFTGAPAEVTVDTTDNRLVVHDGVTAGGHPVAKASEITSATAGIAGKLPKDGSEAMSGNLDLDGNNLVNVGDINGIPVGELPTISEYTTTASGIAVPTGARYCQARGVGGGGGGGGADGQGSGTKASAGGGASGAYGITGIIDLDGVSEFDLTIGAGGGGGTGGAANGASGGHTVFTIDGVNYTWEGGTGGLGASGTSGVGRVGRGGVARSCVNLEGGGQNGQNGGNDAFTSLAPAGGSSPFGSGGGNGTTNGSALTGLDASGYGGGGGGAASDDVTANANGGDGSDGFIRITWFH